MSSFGSGDNGGLLERSEPLSALRDGLVEAGAGQGRLVLLSGEQMEVVGLVVKGLPNAEIAARLVLSPKTVEHHVSAILRKLGVESRLQVRAAAAARGLASTD